MTGRTWCCGASTTIGGSSSTAGGGSRSAGCSRRGSSPAATVESRTRGGRRDEAAASSTRRSSCAAIRRRCTTSASGSKRSGFDHLLVYDHVVGAEHADREPPLWGPYTERDPFHEPLVMFGYLAAVTSRIELATGVMILPQRQTVLVAQQAADADLLSRERVRLGVGTGWNYVEYDALGQDFATRGRPTRRADRRCCGGCGPNRWSRSRAGSTTSSGPASTPGRAGRSRSGSAASPSPPIRRGGRLGDGFTFAGDVDAALEGMARVRHHLSEAGRSADGFGFELIATRARTAAEVVRPPNAGMPPVAPTCRSSRSSSAWTPPPPTSTTRVR